MAVVYALGLKSEPSATGTPASTSVLAGGGVRRMAKAVVGSNTATALALAMAPAPSPLTCSRCDTAHAPSCSASCQQQHNSTTHSFRVAYKDTLICIPESERDPSSFFTGTGIHFRVLLFTRHALIQGDFKARNQPNAF